MSGRFQRHNNFRGGRGRGRLPSIYSNLNKNLNSSTIMDCRFTDLDRQSDQPGSSSQEEVDAFQASLSDFLKQEQKRKESNQSQTGASSSSPCPVFQRNATKEFPQDKPFFCDKCFRGYNTKHMYERHLETHIKCTYEGCKFEANNWFLAKHITNVHEMGISSMGSQSRNDKWIEARKRNFPSKNTIEEKQKTLEERTTKGDVLVATNNFGKFKIQTNKVANNQNPVELHEQPNDKDSIERYSSEKVEDNSKDSNDSDNSGTQCKLQKILKEADRLGSPANNRAANFLSKQQPFEKSSLLEQ
uniref:C2H2-type domain-containing protein n=1 Tax=Romanomermis culicivorax TaxID=13658 RepID=A0A915HXR7_ROMCU